MLLAIISTVKNLDRKLSEMDFWEVDECILYLFLFQVLIKWVIAPEKLLLVDTQF